MEKTYQCLKELLEDQIRAISKRGDQITPEEVLSLKNALSSIEKINKLMHEDVYGEEYSYGRGMYHRGYLEGHDYQNGHNRSPITGRYISNGQSYGGNYDHMYGHSIKDRMIAKLEAMYDETSSDHERQMISNTINRIQSDS